MISSSELPKEDKETYDIKLMEAALYVSGRPLVLKTLASVIRTRSQKKVRKLAERLLEEYSKRDTSLEVLELEDKRFVLQMKAGFSSRVKRLATRPLLTTGPLKTLSYIAYRQPILQKNVTDVRGGHAYSHIRQLIDMGLVDYEKHGRTRLLRTTGYFADFFGLSHKMSTMKRQIKKIFSELSDNESETQKTRKRDESTKTEE